jgi:hypothetical protein
MLWTMTPSLPGVRSREHVADVVRVQRRGLGGHAARKVGIADDGDAVWRDDLLVRHGQVAVAAALGGEIDDHRARLHRRTMSCSPQLRRRPAGDQGRGDDDVNLRREFPELGELLLAELGAGGAA